jgi:hypothetical protein
MKWTERLQAITAALARINAQGARSPVERTIIKGRVQTATLPRATATGRERETR